MTSTEMSGVKSKIDSAHVKKVYIMRLAHLVLTAVALLPLTTQAITLNKLEGTWESPGNTCQENRTEYKFCKFMIVPENKQGGEFYPLYNHAKTSRYPLYIEANEGGGWSVLRNGIEITQLEYDNDTLRDQNNTYHRLY